MVVVAAAAAWVASAGPAQAGECSATVMRVGGSALITANPVSYPCVADYHAALRTNTTSASGVVVSTHEARAITDQPPFSIYSADLRHGDEVALASASIGAVTITVKGNVIHAEGVHAYLDCYATGLDSGPPRWMHQSAGVSRLSINGVEVGVPPEPGFAILIPAVGVLYVGALVPAREIGRWGPTPWIARALWLEGPEGVEVGVAEARLSGGTVLPTC